MASWDAPGASSVARAPNGIEVIRGECVIGLGDWNDYPVALEVVHGMGDSVIGAIPRLRAMRVRQAEPGSEDLSARLAQYRALPFVRYVELNTVVTLGASDSAELPGDTYYPFEWHLENTGQSGGKLDADIDAPAGWAITKGSSSVVVAIIDTGINLAHPEFDGRLLPGWDFADEDNDPTGYGHGNAVAGVMAANADNDFEIAGIDDRCMILPVKIGAGSGSEFDVAQGIDFAAAQHARIISMSVLLIGSSELIHDAVVSAAAQGCIQIAAAGNTSAFGSADNHVPAKYPEVMSIGWTNDSDEREFMSATGATLDFVAPGKDIYTVSSIGDGSKKVESGSSFATPIVSGIAALMLGMNPHLTSDQVYELLRVGAEDQVGDASEDTPGWDPYYGWGRVNLRRSLEALCGCQGGESLIASPQHVSIAAGEALALRIDAGREHAGQAYWVFGSASGTGAWPFGPFTLPITPDDYTRFTFTDANGPILANTHGLLDDAGQAMAFVMLPKGAGPAGPSVLTHVAVVFDGRAAPAHAVLATNVVTTMIEP